MIFRYKIQIQNYITNIQTTQAFPHMPSQKQTLIQKLQQKKAALKQLQQKCQLQNKKIKLFRKENEDLTAVIQQRQQVDTNLLLNSKELLGHNSRMEKTIEELKEQLELAKKNYDKKQAHKGMIQGQQSLDKSSAKPASHHTAKKKPTNISLRDITVTDQTQQIDLPASELTDNDILQLQGFTSLKALIVNDNLLGNPSINIICSGLINLQKLNLANNKFTAQSLEGVKNLKSLKMLDIRNNNLTDQALKHISQVSTLCDLSCSKNALTDQSASYLSNLSNLTYLDITNNQLTSQSVGHLSRLQKVSHLYLMSNKLSKEGIVEMIRKMKGLQFLDVRFNVWQSEEKEEIKKIKHEKLEVFC